MKILVVHLDSKINYCPPAINLVENLLDQGHFVKLVSYNTSELNERLLLRDNLEVYDIGQRKEPKNSLKKYWMRFQTRNQVRQYLTNKISNYDIVWTTSEITVRELGKLLLKAKRHIMQLLELTEYVPAFGGSKIFTFDIQRYAKCAETVVVPEINRAYIIKTWWELPKLPVILPNKPYNTSVESVSEEATRILERVQLEKRKIILYQGGFTADRRFDQFAEAMALLGDDYCLYLMGPDNDYRKKICSQYPNINYLGSLNPPEHLLVAKYAHIGILTYVPVRDGYHSELNAQYCAPNKTYEYALCNLPMIGTNVLGLQNIFKEFEVGACIDEETSDGVVKAINKVEENYEQMRKNCQIYFDSVNLRSIVREIVSPK